MDERELSLLDLLIRRASAERPREGMRLLHLEVEDIFCYRRAELDLEEGITVIAGPNGSGKSSLLESIFFALYGSRASPAMGRSLGEILREGAREGRVRLDFLLGGRRFTVEMGLKRQGDRVISEREGCRLVSEEGAAWVGVEEATARVQELLRMDRDDFVNCAYIRQGEIDRLIRAGEEERRRMIDRLLRLERLDSYAARAKEGARRAVNRRLAALEGEVTSLQREIAALEGEGLHRERAHLEREISRYQEELERLEGERTRLEEARAEVRERLRRLAEAERELEEGKAEWREKKGRLKEREGELERLRLLLEGLGAREGEQRSALERMLEELGLPQEELLAALKRARVPEELSTLSQALAESGAQLEGLKAEAGRLREGLARLEAELSHLQSTMENLDSQVYELRDELAGEREGLAREEAAVEELRSEIEGLGAQLKVCNFEADGLEGCQRAHAQRLKELQGQKEGLQERLVAAKTEREQAAEELAEKEELLHAGRCPTCGQRVTAETVAGTMVALKERLHELDGTIQRLREDLAGALATGGREGEAGPTGGAAAEGGGLP
ncbi:MAG: AAA family ATPase [Candidatus Bipolaricaulia bacterium]